MFRIVLGFLISQYFENLFGDLPRVIIIIIIIIDIPVTHTVRKLFFISKQFPFFFLFYLFFFFFLVLHFFFFFFFLFSLFSFTQQFIHISCVYIYPLPPTKLLLRLNFQCFKLYFHSYTSFGLLFHKDNP